MNYDVLLLVDMQTALVEAKPYNKTAVISNISGLLQACREKKIPIIYVQHDGGIGDELESGTAGWAIYEELAPLAEEKVIEKQYNSAFRETELKEYLQKNKMQSLILCGMQSEYCVDTTCKVAFEYEYDITIPQGTTTTFDSAFASGKQLSEYYENKIWRNRFARVTKVEQVIAEING
ncbi:cysteine hydrolase family protein [Scatolibacter rhodanostii]|uniref:cysteine hydrolase family protein n=1 Tax=Scatolibacter rhodanostii TaxID=2014781 RepID=UPI000C07FD1B|nr:cysteine hydrolase family protein [Scatolibacter rhodanostii]